MKKDQKVSDRKINESRAVFPRTGTKTATDNTSRVLVIPEERLNLQQMIIDISALFINVPTREIDKQLVQGLQHIATFVDVDRCSYGTFSEDLSELRITHSWAVSEDTPIGQGILSKTLPYFTDVLKSGKFFVMEKPADLPKEATSEIEYCRRSGLKSHLTVPVTVGGKLVGALGLASVKRYCTWPKDFIDQFLHLANVFALVLYRKKTEEKLTASYEEIRQMASRLQAEKNYLRDEIKQNFYRFGIIGKSTAISEVLQKVEQVARTNSTVLITGETGTGKEVAARAIHQESPRSRHVLVKVNCASLPPTLFESELFGREKGAYTGALSRQSGRFEIADGSTIFLDEISELSLDLQAKLLQVIQDGTFERLGSSTMIRVNVRIIAATNRDLVKAIREGSFREDLFYRLNVFPIEIPPLRERKEDIPDLALAFIGEVLYIEQWQNKEALHRHIRSELYLKFLAAMELGMERPELAIHEVTESQGMALIEKLRQVEKV